MRGGILANHIYMTTIRDLLREYIPNDAVFKSGPRKGQPKPGKWVPVPFSRALQVRPSECRTYAATDALATARIARRLDAMLDDGGGWARRYYESFEKPLVPVLLSMERAGVRIDPQALHDAEAVILAARARTELSLREVFGPDIGLGSTQQMGPVLAQLGLIDGKRTDSGELGCAKSNILGAFGVEKEEDLPDSDEGRIARNLLEWRQMGKLKSTYVDAILSRLDSESRVHGRYNQAVTNTNRLSSSDPNLQNIPARTDIGMAIRKAFIPKDGCVFVGGDFSQLQLRVWAEFTRDDVFVKAYTEGGEKADFHQYAATALGRPRSTIKNFVFCILFGGEEAKAAVTAGLPGAEIAPFIAQMRQDIPSLSTFKLAVGDMLSSKGYVESLQGWRGFFPDWFSPVRQWQAAALREATNFPIQATEAGLVKAFMAEVYGQIQGMQNVRPVLQVHDEFWLEAPEEFADALAIMMKCVAEEVSRRWFSVVPIKFDTKIVTNWAAAK